MITKEEFIKNTNEDEVFAVFHSILMRINDTPSRINEGVEIFDREIGDAIKDLLRCYK